MSAELHSFLEILEKNMLSMLLQIVGRSQFLVAIGLGSLLPCRLSQEAACIPHLYAHLHHQTSDGTSTPSHASSLSVFSFCLITPARSQRTFTFKGLRDEIDSFRQLRKISLKFVTLFHLKSLFAM